MIILTLLDTFLLAIVVLWSGDEVRRLRAAVNPVRLAIFCALAIVSFGWIAHNIQVSAVHWWAVMLHAALAVVAMFAFGHHHPEEGHRHELGRQPPRRPV